MNLIVPKDYNPVLNLRDTEIAIKLVKDFFEQDIPWPSGSARP